jgi:hypothetical protein
MSGVLSNLNGNGNIVLGRKRGVLLKNVFLPWKSY